MRIAHFGTFDVENYGDALFPLLLERDFPDADITHFSPVGGRPWPDCVEPVSSLSSPRLDDDFDAVVVGGGNIIQVGRTRLAAYRDIATLAYPSLWIGAAALASRQRVPLLYNAPGVLRPDLARSAARHFAADALTSATYLAVRDAPSADVVRCLGAEPQVVPDTALAVASLWSTADLARIKAEVETGPVVTVHLKRRTLTDPPDAVAAALDRLADRHEARIVLVAIGRCHGDHLVQESIADRMRSRPVVVSKPAGVRQIAALIACSELFVGASLHGMITAVAFGVPAMQVVQPGGLPKFDGFARHVGATGSMAGSWFDATARPAPRPYDSTHALEAIARHRARLSDGLDGRPANAGRRTEWWAPALRALAQVDRVQHRLGRMSGAR